MFEEIDIFFDVGEKEYFADDEKDGGFCVWVFMLLKIFFNEFGDFCFAIDVVGDTVISYAMHLFYFKADIF